MDSCVTRQENKKKNNLLYVNREKSFIPKASYDYLRRQWENQKLTRVYLITKYDWGHVSGDYVNNTYHPTKKKKIT